MPVSRKRVRRELDSDNSPPPKEPSMLQRIRNMWQFANLFQFILLFGPALKLDDNLDIEDLEAECLTPGSTVLQDIGLGLLKYLSSHRGLTHELFDEYTRRQFLAKAPEKNPFGTAETPARFAEFDVFTKIRVLQLMTQLVMVNPEKLRERTEEQKDTDQTNWRIEPYGWDRHDRTYFVLDDNRLYRLTDAPPSVPKPKKNTKKARAAQRASKRRRVSSGVASDNEDAGDEASESGAAGEPEDDGLGGMKWECVAVTLDEVREFLSSIQKTKDENEKVLRDQVNDHLLPILEKQEESRKRKQLQREKELLSLEKMAHAKRSTRLAGKAEQQKIEERTREEEKKRREEEATRRKEEQQRLKMERERDNRLMSREQRVKERETRRRLHEEELAQLSEDSKGPVGAAARMSERRRLAEIERNKRALQELEEEEEDWIFDCACGVYGQVDDGSHSVACERCNTWQHSKCLGIKEEEADQDDFHFICSSCQRRETETNEPRPRTIKLKVNRQEEPGSPSDKQSADNTTASQPPRPQKLVVELQSRPSSSLADRSEPSRAASAQVATTSAAPAQPTDNISSSSVSGLALSQQSPTTQGNNPFSSPHPSLLPPGGQSTKTVGPNPTIGNPASLLTGHDDGQPKVVAKSAGSGGSLSALAGSGSGGSSPSKQPHRPPSPPTKTSISALTASNGTTPSLSARNMSGTASSPSIGLPHLTPVQPHDVRSDHAASSPPLPPSSGGLSPTKHSPPAPRTQQQVNGGNSIALPLLSSSQPSAPVFPPVAALSPSPRQQILTPPVKPTDAVRIPLPQQPSQQGLQTPVLAPSSSPRLDGQSK